jgi:hypothetical protein
MAYLEAHFSYTWTPITGDFRTNAVPQAEPGDLIFYNWGDGEGISHVSIVVDIASGEYPEVSEMSQWNFGFADSLLNKIVHVHSPYVKRGWTWSAVKHEWLQREFPRVTAYLLHFNGGLLAPTF